MRLQDKVDIQEVNAEEGYFLLRVCEMLGKGREGLQASDLGVVQGALRAAYNGLTGLIEDSGLLTANRKKELRAQNQRIYEIREAIVKGAEGIEREPKEVEEAENAYVNLGEIKKVLKSYARKWYRCKAS